MRAPTSFTVLASAAVLSLAGCGDGENEFATESGATTAESKAVMVSIADFSYEPAQISVAPGAEITFDNEDEAKHTATAEDESFDTDSIEGGASGTIRAPDQPGTYEFVCTFHANMNGTLVVE